MDKLFNLKEWLTVADTARHLSIVFGEDVTEADVLRLALDGRLRLSVYFVNHAYARCSKVVGYDQVEWYETPPELAAIYRDKNYKPHHIMKSLYLDNERFLNLTKEVVTLRDVWDLPMIGNECLDIEHEYQNLINGPAVTLQGLDGAFVEGTDGTMCQLQESYDKNEYQAGSTAALRKIKEYISFNNFEKDKAQELLDKHKQQRKEYLEKKQSRDYSEDFYPAGGLPEDSLLVVRTDALRQFEQRLSHGERKQNAEDLLSESERNSLLKLVFGMAVAAYQYDPGKNRNSATGENRGSIAADLSRLGLNLNADTVRKFIKEAEERFSDLIPKSDNS